MRFLPPEDEVNLYEEGFGDDLLGRVKGGKALSELLERIEDPLVVAMDGRWGTGKTHFLKRWVGAHKLQNSGTATTVYFDAFANDYLEEPLIALVAALSERIGLEKQSQMDQVKTVALRFVKPLARIGLSLATFGATEALGDLGDAVVAAVGDEAKKGVDQFWQREEGRRAAMEEFRTALATLMTTGQEDEGKEVSPLVFVVDELDRCRPDYALQVLEVLKHFFAVPRVHFVLGANLNALANSVKARYGAGVDATSYLQKFISFTFSLPDYVGDFEESPAIIEYARHLGQEMGIRESIQEIVINHMKAVSRNTHISIRDVGKIYSALALLPGKVLAEGDLPGRIEVMATLVVSKVVRPDLYPKFLDASVKIADIVEYFDATALRTSRRVGDEPNPEYDHQVNLRYMIWAFIIGGVLDEHDTKNVGSLFDRYWSPDHSRRIPRRLHKDWLDLFHAT